MSIIGEYSFSFTKVNETGAALPGVMFSLYISEDFSVGADRFVYSNNDGVVAFKNLPAGTFYIQETIVPSEYMLDNTVYKVVLSNTGFEIYYGKNYENKLSEHGNKIVNKLNVQSVSITLKGTKNLTGKTLSSGMFSFVVKDNIGSIIATGSNTESGSITFNSINFNEPGIYTFMVEEVIGTYSGITYDLTKFNVTVTVIDDGSGKLTAEVYYPSDDIVFNNKYSETPVKPCPCYALKTKCRTSIKGKIIWEDNDNAENKRPAYAEVILLRDGEVYKRIDVESTGDGTFVFCCVPIKKNPRHKYSYQIDELNVPDGYIKTIKGYKVINMFNH